MNKEIMSAWLREFAASPSPFGGAVAAAVEMLPLLALPQTVMLDEIAFRQCKALQAFCDARRSENLILGGYYLEVLFVYNHCFIGWFSD